jgi:hypothetical protein
MRAPTRSACRAFSSSMLDNVRETPSSCSSSCAIESSLGSLMRRRYRAVMTSAWAAANPVTCGRLTNRLRLPAKHSSQGGNSHTIGPKSTKKAPFPGPLSWAILGSNTWAGGGCASLRGCEVF